MIAVDLRLARPGFALDVAFAADAPVVALFGPSGSGKSTIIRLIAGLERPASGRIVAGGRVLFDAAARIDLAPRKRRLGLVFQDGQLFPHLSVRANLGYGQRFRAKAERRIGFDAVVQTLAIGGLLDRAPRSLSGGEKQRVAMGRAMLMSPDMLLMDEPLAALDQALKNDILAFIERLRDEFAIPILYVSHAVDEVARLAGHVVRLAGGKVVAHGPPGEVLAGAAEGGGESLSVIEADWLAQDQPHGVTVLEHPAGRIVAPGFAGGPGRRVRIVIAASQVALAPAGSPPLTSMRTVLAGTIETIAAGPGAAAEVTLVLTGGDRLRARLTRLAIAELGLAQGVAVYALIKSATIDAVPLAGSHADV
jgi:molybdate transport system ATP-binding protein